MSDTRNQWIPVSERLPEDPAKRYLVIHKTGAPLIAFIQGGRCWHASGACSEIPNVTHWMDLPEPPAPPKPADPFEAWYETQPKNPRWPSPECELMRSAWNAAKEHYAKPLPDFEAWAKGRCADGPFLRVLDRHTIVHANVCRAIWNAAQGKPEA